MPFAAHGAAPAHGEKAPAHEPVERAPQAGRLNTGADAKVQLASADPKAKPKLLPREVTLFQVDATGELEVGPSGKAPPPDFIKLKF